MSLLNIAVYALLFSCVYSFLPKDCCSTKLSFLCTECYGACPLREDGLSILPNVLRNRVYGQEYAMDLIVNALKNKEPNKCISFHFSGDNGVGKTLTALTISEALFSVKNMITQIYKGVLYLRGNHYISSPQTILQEIFEQLEHCEHSLIIFDEAELPEKETMQIFEEILDEQPLLSFKGRQVNKSNAIFILISDFGMYDEQPTTIEEIKECIYNDMKNTWKHGKQVDTINHIIPFVSLQNILTQHDLDSLDYTSIASRLPQSFIEYTIFLIENQITNTPVFITNNLKIKLQNITVRNSELQLIAAVLYTQAMTHYGNRNYRGIEQTFSKLFNVALTNTLVSTPCNSLDLSINAYKDTYKIIYTCIT